MKYCAEQGCNTLIEKHLYCDAHKRKPKRTYKHANKSLYNSSAWKQVSDYVYERDKGLCQRCGKFVHGRAAHRHHIVPARDNIRLALDADNIILLCNVCHPIVERGEEHHGVPHYFTR